MKDKEYIVKKKITINAKLDAIWDALTNPEKTKEYFFGCSVHSNWKPGSAITFKRKILWIFPFEMKGKIIKTEPEKLLQYTLKNSGSSTTSTVTDELTYHDGKTTLSVSDNVGSGDGAEKRYKKSVKGWDKILHGLKEFVESESS